jgi:CRP-like cAMP-binding protein
MLDENGGAVTAAWSANALLGSLPPADLRSCKPQFEQVEIDAGTSFASLGSYVFFVEEGVATLSFDKSGLTVGFVGNEGMVGAFGGMGLGEEPFLATAVTSITALRISDKDFERAVDDLPAVRRAVLGYVRNVMCDLTAEVHKVATNSLCARVAAWLLAITERGATYPLPITHHALASCLDVRRAGVTDALHILEGYKAVRSTRGSITVLDVGILRQAAGKS